MNLILEIFVTNGFILDALGVIGLGLMALAAVRLSQRYQSWGGSLLACGSLLLLLGRLWSLLSSNFITPEIRESMGRTLSEVVSMTPLALLTMGLAGIVWGLWGHEQWLREEH